MSKSNFSEDFKRHAVRQITERGYPVAEAFQRLGVSQHSLYERKKKFAASNAKGSDGAEKISLSFVLAGSFAQRSRQPDVKSTRINLQKAAQRWLGLFEQLCADSKWLPALVKPS